MDIYERQQHMHQQLVAKERITRQMETLDQQIQAHEHIRRQLFEVFTKEKQDLYRLDQLTVSNVWRRLRGTQETQRTIEEEEAARAELKLREHEAMIDTLRRDRHQLYETWLPFDGLEAEWDALLREKERHLRMDPTFHQELDALSDKQVEQEGLLIELKEAYGAGVEARKRIMSTLDHLERAHGWSTYDTFFGGGLIATSLKHEALDDSEQTMHFLQRALERFGRELQDVTTLTAELNVERGSLLQFADYFLDDIISEWTLHGRINDSLEQLRRLDRDIERLLTMLAERTEATRQRYELLVAERKRLIVTR